MVRYPVVLLDLDHTLFDSDASEREAFDRTFRRAGTSDPGPLFATYVAINTALWAAVERGELKPSAVRTRRFEELVTTAGLDADPGRLADDFVAGLASCGGLYPGAREVLDELRSLARLALVTNGLSEVQRTRVARLGLSAHFHAVVISGEVGVAKPAPAFFDVTFERLGSPRRDGALMVGDSLTADIRGGHAAGVTTCWYNPHGRGIGDGPEPDHVIASLAELVPLVRAA